MGKKGLHVILLALACLLLLVVVTSMAMGAEAATPEIYGSQPPFLGPWYIDEDTVMEGGELNLSMNVHVMRGVRLLMVNTTFTILHDYPHEREFTTEDGSTLFVINSTLNLDTFSGEAQASLNFEGGSQIRTTGRFYGSCNSFFAEDTTFINLAPNGGPDEHGEDAIFIADGKVNSEFIRVTIKNQAGKAGDTSPGLAGANGGMAQLISNVSAWIDCTIECIAGISRGGGLGLTGSGGGAGGLGGDVEMRIRGSFFQNVMIYAKASEGGSGARGARNVSGNGGSGGNGADGGDAYVKLDSTNILEMYNVSITTISGNAGSGGKGGGAINGVGGTGGDGGDAGFSMIEISSIDEIIMEGIQMNAIGGMGGYGGDYGRLDSGTGSFGVPSPGGEGGDASIKVLGLLGLTCEDVGASTHGGAGLDGGGGYDQGETGGRGGDAEVSFQVDASIEAEDIDLNAIGGRGGPGGPAESDIEGNGGDGGLSRCNLETTGSIWIENSAIIGDSGVGGQGRSVRYNGADGFSQWLVTAYRLDIRNSTLGYIMNFLHPSGYGRLFNVTFELDPPVDPHDRVTCVEDGIVDIIQPVIVRVVDNPDPTIANVMPGMDVEVITLDESDSVGMNVTDSTGECYFELASYRYTALEADHVGRYYFVVTSSSINAISKERREIFGPSVITIVFVTTPPWPYVRFDTPAEGDEIHVFSDADIYLETEGRVEYEGDRILSMGVHLYRQGDDPVDWPTFQISQQNGWLWVDRPEEKWGYFFSPPEKPGDWRFFYRFPLFGENLTFVNGTYVFRVLVTTEFWHYDDQVEFSLMIDANRGRPTVTVITPIEGQTFRAPVLVTGSAADDYNLTRVERSINGVPWKAVNGTDSWSYVLPVDQLSEGVHFIEFRSWDGERFSEVVRYEFIVDLQDDKEEDDVTIFHLENPWILGLLVLVILVSISLVIIFLHRTRAREPD